MKRNITVHAGAVQITATINTKGAGLTRDEVELIRDDLADSLQSAASNLRWIGVPRNRVHVR